jgi:phospholipid/cholesterol/gamma-HCH transport system ATP-binding protein
VIDELMVRTREALGVTSVVITHDMRSAYTVGDRIAMLFQGKVQQVGTVAEIRESGDPVVRGFIEGRADAKPAEQSTPLSAEEALAVEGAAG